MESDESPQPHFQNLFATRYVGKPYLALVDGIAGLVSLIKSAEASLAEIKSASAARIQEYHPEVWNNIIPYSTAVCLLNVMEGQQHKLFNDPLSVPHVKIAYYAEQDYLKNFTSKEIRELARGLRTRQDSSVQDFGKLTIECFLERFPE